MPAHRRGTFEPRSRDRIAPDARTPDGSPYSEVVHRFECSDGRLGCNQLLQLLSGGGSNLRAGCLQLRAG